VVTRSLETTGKLNRRAFIFVHDELYCVECLLHLNVIVYVNSGDVCSCMVVDVCIDDSQDDSAFTDSDNTRH
jgi:hypothetical protein